MASGAVEFRDSTTTQSLMSYGRVRWNNTASFINTTYSFVEQRQPGVGEQVLPQNARTEVRNSLGLLNGQQTRALLDNNPDPAYHDSGELEDFGFLAPPRSAPPASLGTAAGSTATTIATQFSAGFDSLRQQHLSTLAAGLDLGSSALPFVSSQLATTLGLTDQLQSAVSGIDLSSVTSMLDLRSRLEAAGFSVDSILSDSQLAALPANAPADYLRVSKTYRLLSLTGSAGFDPAALGPLADLAGVGLSGSLTASTDVALHLTVGLDSGGFYLLPGLVLDAPTSIAGELAATLGEFGTVKGDGTVDIRPTVNLSTVAADGRVRLAALAASSVTADIQGAAAVDLGFTSNIFEDRPIDFGGRWVWQVGNGGFAYDADSSGFDADSLLDAVAGYAEDGVEALFDQSAKLGALVKSVPVIGTDLGGKLAQALNGRVDLSGEDLPTEKLRALGFTVSLASGLTPRSFVDGSYLDAADLINVRFQTTFNPSIPAYATTGGFSLTQGGVPISGTLSGNIALGSPTLALDLGFGVDASNGVYVTEGSTIEFQFSPTATLSGTARVGDLVQLGASATAAYAIDAKLVIDNFDGQSGKLYLTANPAGSIGDVMANPRATTLGGTASFALTLSVANPAVSIPNIGAVIAEVLPTFDWHADARYVVTPTAGGGFTTNATYSVTDTTDQLTGSAKTRSTTSRHRSGCGSR